MIFGALAGAVAGIVLVAAFGFFQALFDNYRRDVELDGEAVGWAMWWATALAWAHWPYEVFGGGAIGAVLGALKRPHWNRP